MTVPKLQNFEEKQCRMDIAQYMSTTFNDYSDLLKKVITGDESSVYDYDIEIKPNTIKRTLSLVKSELFAHCFLRLQRRGASSILAAR